MLSSSPNQLASQGPPVRQAFKTWTGHHDQIMIRGFGLFFSTLSDITSTAIMEWVITLQRALLCPGCLGMSCCSRYTTQKRSYLVRNLGGVKLIEHWIHQQIVRFLRPYLRTWTRANKLRNGWSCWDSISTMQKWRTLCMKSKNVTKEQRKVLLLSYSLIYIWIDGYKVARKSLVS